LLFFTALALQLTIEGLDPVWKQVFVGGYSINRKADLL
jgi:hypothetical protein